MNSFEFDDKIQIEFCIGSITIQWLFQLNT